MFSHAVRLQPVYNISPTVFVRHLDDDDGECRKQEELVYSVRKRLEEALMADMLAHVEEAAGEEDSLKEDGNSNDDLEAV